MPRVRRAEADAEIIDIISFSTTPGDRIRGPVKVTGRHQAAVTVLRPGQGRELEHSSDLSTIQALTSWGGKTS
jgi:hypothetical protein